MKLTKQFTISRLENTLGTFRLSGHFLSREGIGNSKIDFTSIEILGTDGWLEITLTTDEQLKVLTDSVSEHLDFL